MRIRTYRRSKKKFKSARAAWIDIGKKTGKKASQVEDKAH
ncbi:hypothetical protein LCGC14_2435370, partial [marine sediment metagenome]